jgi:phosphatidylglycerol lysyltransferase
VAKDALPLYVDVGLTLFKIGEGARVPLEAFSLEGGRRRAFRRALHRAEDQGCTFQVVPQPEAELLLPDLKAISDAWLLHKNTREKRFSLGFFSEDYVRQCPVALVRLAGKPVAFANLWLTGGKEEMSPDLMRYSADAPPEVMEYLFVKLMLWGKEQGYQYFDLGNAPLSGIEARPAAPLWNKFGVFVYSHGEHFYNFQGLRQFKERFDPVWEPRYLACPGGLALPRVLVDLAALVSGGVQGIVAR